MLIIYCHMAKTKQQQNYTKKSKKGRKVKQVCYLSLLFVVPWVSRTAQCSAAQRWFTLPPLVVFCYLPFCNTPPNIKIANFATFTLKTKGFAIHPKKRVGSGKIQRENENRERVASLPMTWTAFECVCVYVYLCFWYFALKFLWSSQPVQLHLQLNSELLASICTWFKTQTLLFHNFILSLSIHMYICMGTRL